jgi:sensor domain CHASE-containing protein
MEYLPTLINALVVAVVGALVTYLTRTQIQDVKQDLKGDIAEVKQNLTADIAAARSEIRDVRSELRTEVATLRSDLTQIALALGAWPRPQTG